MLKSRGNKAAWIWEEKSQGEGNHGEQSVLFFKEEFTDSSAVCGLGEMVGSRGQEVKQYYSDNSMQVKLCNEAFGWECTLKFRTRQRGGIMQHYELLDEILKRLFSKVKGKLEIDYPLLR